MNQFILQKSGGIRQTGFWLFATHSIVGSIHENTQEGLSKMLTEHLLLVMQPIKMCF